MCDALHPPHPLQRVQPPILLLRATWSFCGSTVLLKSRRICWQKSRQTACRSRYPRACHTAFVSYITTQDGRLPSQQFNMLLLSFARRVTETPSVAEVLFSSATPPTSHTFPPFSRSCSTRYLSSILSGCPHLCGGLPAHACVSALVSAAASSRSTSVTYDKIMGLVTSTLNCR